MSKIWEETESALRLAAEQMKTYYNRKCTDTCNYKPGDKVWLEGQNVVILWNGFHSIYMEF